MTNLRHWTYHLVATFIFLLAAFAAGQDTANESSCTWPHEGTVYDEEGRQIIQAEEIRQCIHDGKNVHISNALVKGILDLSFMTVTEAANFSSTTFTEDADFSFTEFITVPNFSGTTFTGDANFLNARFTRGAGFSKTTFNRDAVFSNIRFDKDTFFRDTTFNGEAFFYKSTFVEDAFFSETAFNGKATFAEITFNGDAVFGVAIFNGDATFQDTTFTSDADFSGAIFNGETNFLGLTFLYASPSATILSAAWFSYATFAKDVDFSNIAFAYVDFSNADFQGEVRLNSASVAGTACFFDARFANLASFWQFKAPFGKVVFTSSRFNDKVIFNASEFKDIDFSPQADLRNCRKGWKTIFPPASFFDQVNFRNSKVGRANFQEALFNDLNLSGSTFDTLIFSDTLYNKLFYTGSTINFFKALNNGFNANSTTDKQKYDTLDRLRTNFKGFGQISMTNEAYYQKTFMEQSYDPETEAKLEWNKLGFWSKVGLAWNYVSFYISGYFVKPQRAFGGSLLLIAFFGLIYFLVDTVSFFVSSKKAKDKIPNPVAWQTITDDKQRAAAWFEIARQFNTQPIKKKRNALSIVKLLSQKFWNALLFSFSKFTKIKLDRIPDKRIHWLETIEWTIGLIMLASLTVSIANSIPGLERIVGAILPG
jgi:uncharacterized protein YjbI with pentapeptide repeats